MLIEPRAHNRPCQVGPGRFTPRLNGHFVVSQGGVVKLPSISELGSLIKVNADGKSIDLRDWQRTAVTMFHETPNLNRGLPQPFVLAMRWLGLRPIDFCPNGFVTKQRRAFSREVADGKSELLIAEYEADEDGFVHYFRSLTCVIESSKLPTLTEELFGNYEPSPLIP